MTAYATRADLYALGLPVEAMSGVSSADQDAAIEASSRRADSYLRTRYGVPCPVAPRELVWAVCVLAAYDLITTRGYSPDVGADQTLRDRANDALAWLRDVAKGVVALDPSADATPSVSESAPLMSYEEDRGW